MKKCIIVIPIYKDTPSVVERASFNQVLSILKKHEICIVTYKECNLSVYKQISTIIEKTYSVEYFDKRFFASIEGYNDLCYSRNFYLRFSSYEYMLIYQLDAWVFRDELLYWCCKGYDYIGAPIFYIYDGNCYTNKFMGVGNGGFSLQKISHCLNVLNSKPRHPIINFKGLVVMYWNLMLYNKKYSSLVNKLLIIPTILIKAIGFKNNLNYFVSSHKNEDAVFSIFTSERWGKFGNIPTEKEAMMFSFEVNPKLLFKINNNNLPFGCHAFEKYDYTDFWENYIKIPYLL